MAFEKMKSIGVTVWRRAGAGAYRLSRKADSQYKSVINVCWLGNHYTFMPRPPISIIGPVKEAAVSGPQSSVKIGSPKCNSEKSGKRASAGETDNTVSKKSKTSVVSVAAGSSSVVLSNKDSVKRPPPTDRHSPDPKRLKFLGPMVEEDTLDNLGETNHEIKVGIQKCETKIYENKQGFHIITHMVTVVGRAKKVTLAIDNNSRHMSWLKPLQILLQDKDQQIPKVCPATLTLTGRLEKKENKAVLRIKRTTDVVVSRTIWTHNNYLRWCEAPGTK